MGITVHEAHEYGICFKRAMYNKGEPFDMYGPVKSSRCGHGFQCHYNEACGQKGDNYWVNPAGVAGLCSGEDGELQWSLQTKKHHWWQDRK